MRFAACSSPATPRRSAKMNELSEASHKLAEQLYAAQGAAAGGGGAGAAGPSAGFQEANFDHAAGGFQQPDGNGSTQSENRKAAGAEDVNYEVVDED